MPRPSPSLRSQAARIGGLSLHVDGDSNAIAARARAGFDQRFVKAVAAANPALSPNSNMFRQKVELARRVYFARLALRSAQARAKRGVQTRLNDNTASMTADGAVAR